MFIKNILKRYLKYNQINLHQCFACDYKIENNLIASHIYRFSDINHDLQNKKINKETAYNLAFSGENGFLLCPNHDKEFEKGMIIFDFNLKKFIVNTNNLSEFSFKEISKNLNSQNFNLINFSNTFISNLNKYFERITNI
ncbi:HNH endonuclease signature motif containing protein [[Mycoplasma] collis]|uniref:HNH endonuclease signature motif containing protein n=1 Tax=[Mycoplasma] collis TaxID=2127 RepID=UPI00051C8CE3|nr:HNH endonuclease signature motif containing protein [[Mycoplasma] collis]